MFEVIKETNQMKNEQYCKQKMIKIDSKYILVFNSYPDELSMLFNDSDCVMQIDKDKFMYITDNLELVEEKYHFLKFNLENYMVIDFDFDNGEIIVFQGFDNIMKYKKIPSNLKVKDDGITSISINGDVKGLFIYDDAYYTFNSHVNL